MLPVAQPLIGHIAILPIISRFLFFLFIVVPGNGERVHRDSLRARRFFDFGVSHMHSVAPRFR